MFELALAFVAVALLLGFACVHGRADQQAMQQLVLQTPEQVARLYLRQVDEADAWWLHVELRNGRKHVLAAPWETVAVLARLQAHGLELGAEDAARLAGAAEGTNQAASVSRAASSGVAVLEGRAA
ncbi:MAG: hypothetical protein RBR77_00375 [Thauera sp.]|jgi:hypothetical protein|nr:hypothetical protein [Thauera sp.]